MASKRAQTTCDESGFNTVIDVLIPNCTVWSNKWKLREGGGRVIVEKGGVSDRPSLPSKVTQPFSSPSRTRETTLFL